VKNCALGPMGDASGELCKSVRYHPEPCWQLITMDDILLANVNVSGCISHGRMASGVSCLSSQQRQYIRYEVSGKVGFRTGVENPDTRCESGVQIFHPPQLVSFLHRQCEVKFYSFPACRTFWLSSGGIPTKNPPRR